MHAGNKLTELNRMHEELTELLVSMNTLRRLNGIDLVSDELFSEAGRRCDEMTKLCQLTHNR
jgi:hypothetical protein